jgi:hypothetical protein
VNTCEKSLRWILKNWRSPSNQVCACILFFWVGVACSADHLTQEQEDFGRYHVIRADADGMALDLTQHEAPPFSSAEKFRDYVEQMLTHARTKAGTNTVKLLIHVHGGLNTEHSTFYRLEKIVPAVLQETDYYPILISWPSGPWSTYGETLVSIRRGRKASKWLGVPTAPFILGTDLAESAAQMPLNWFYQGYNIKERVSALYLTNWLSDLYQVALLKGRLYTNAAVELSEFYYPAREKVINTFRDVTQGPIRSSLGTLGQSSIAQEAWKNMKRRTLNMFMPALLFDKPPKGVPAMEWYREVRSRGAGAFFQILGEFVAKNPNQQFEITFVGHSMGALVVNNVLTQYRNDFIKNRALKRIVYMAAACSVNDGLQAIKPLLEEYNRSTNLPPRLQFYNLTLNPVAELAERSAYGFTPPGSLLEWIDQHLENPDSVVHRTLGSEVNVLASLDAFEEIWPYCKFKAFDRAYGAIPSEHGDFNKSPFWREEFWELGKRHHLKGIDNPVNCYRADWQKLGHCCDTPHGNSDSESTIKHDIAR